MAQREESSFCEVVILRLCETREYECNEGMQVNLASPSGEGGEMERDGDREEGEVGQEGESIVRRKEKKKKSQDVNLSWAAPLFLHSSRCTLSNFTFTG